MTRPRELFKIFDLDPWSFFSLPSLKTSSKFAPENLGGSQKERVVYPSTIFQGQETVSFREGKHGIRSRNSGHLSKFVSPQLKSPVIQTIAWRGLALHDEYR